MQMFEVVPGLKLSRPDLEAAIERCVEDGNLDAVDHLLPMLDAADADPDVEVDWENEYDFRNAPLPPVDPVTGADIIQEWIK